MTTNLLDWHEDDQVIDPKAEYRLLLNGLRRTQGFGLFFAQCSTFGGAKIIQQVQRDLAVQTINVLTFETPISDGNVFKQVQLFLAAHPDTQILFIQGLELSLLDYEESKKRLGWSSEKIFSYSWQGVPPVLINLNQQREHFRDSFSTRLVFLLPVFAIKYLIHRAPDFFDWRSGIAQFNDDRLILIRETERISLEGDYTQYCLWSQAQRNRRILEIQSVLDADPRVEFGRLHLYLEQGNLFVASSDYEAAIAVYDEALVIKPDDHAALHNKGNALYKLGRYEEAILAYDAAFAIKPDLHEALSQKGAVLGDLGRYEEAILAYDAALAIQPGNYEALHNKGSVLGKLGRCEEAILAYDAALAIQPGDYEALHNKGTALIALGQFEATIAVYDVALTIKPDNHAALINKGFALSKLGRYEEAITAYDAALEIKPDKHEALHNKGVALSALGRYEEAITAYDAALTIKPDKYEAWGLRGVALVKLEKFESALSSYDKVLSIKPDDDYAFYKKACCYSLQGKVEPALEHLQQAIQLSPEEYCELAQTDTDFDLIRDDPQFQALIAVENKVSESKG